MKLIPILMKYKIPNAAPIGCFEAVLSPDGWEHSRYVNDSGGHLQPNEIEDFSNVVKGFFHECPEQSDLRKFAKKYGTDIDAVTIGFRFDTALMSYIATLSGYALSIEPYRKSAG